MENHNCRYYRQIIYQWAMVAENLDERRFVPSTVGARTIVRYEKRDDDRTSLIIKVFREAWFTGPEVKKTDGYTMLCHFFGAYHVMSYDPCFGCFGPSFTEAWFTPPDPEVQVFSPRCSDASAPNLQSSPLAKTAIGVPHLSRNHIVTPVVNPTINYVTMIDWQTSTVYDWQKPNKSVEIC